MKKKVFSIILISLLLSACTAQTSTESISTSEVSVEEKADNNEQTGTSNSLPDEIESEYEFNFSDITLEMLDNAENYIEASYKGTEWDEGKIVLLTTKNEYNASIYAVNMWDLIFREGDDFYLLEDKLGGPQIFDPDFALADYDGDGNDELALVTCKGAGTGCLQMELSIYEKKRGHLNYHAPDYTEFVDEISKWYGEQNPDKENYFFGDIYSTEIKGNNIVVTFSVGFMEEGEAYPQYYNDWPVVMADLHYNLDGTFALSDIRYSQMNMSYQDIIDAAQAVLDGESDRLILTDIVQLSLEFRGINKDYQQLGYLIQDIDGDGTEELLFGENPVANNPDWRGRIYDIYTIFDGGSIQKYDGWSRKFYKLTKDRVIDNVSTPDGFTVAHSFWQPDNGIYKHKETVIQINKPDEAGNPQTIWYYSKTLPAEYLTQVFDDSFKVISEAEAKDILGKYEYVYLEFVPFK